MHGAKRAMMMDCDTSGAATPTDGLMDADGAAAYALGTVQVAEALRRLQTRVQRIQRARHEAVEARRTLEARADHLDAALDAARAAREDSKRRAAVRAARTRRDRAVAATAAVEREVAVLDARVEAQLEAYASAPEAKHRRRVAAPAPAQPVPPPPPTETPPPPGTEDYRACLARALANAKDATETLALARVYARTVTT